MGERKGLVFVSIAAVLFSVGGLGVKLIPWKGLSISCFRSLLAVVVLLLFAKAIHHPLRLTRGVVIGAVAVCCNSVFFTIATKLTTAANAILLEFTSPIFVILFLWLVFHETPRRPDIVACVFVFAGIGCFVLDGLGQGNLLGNILAVFAGMGYAWVFLMNRLPGGDALFSTILGQCFSIAIGLPSLVTETDFSPPTLFWAVVMGVLQLGLAYVFLTTGLRSAPPVPASLVAGIEPVLNPILVALVVGETLSGWSVLGGVVVFTPVMVYNVIMARQPKEEGEPARS